jgi:uncharacterized repeat protein (TIGR02543 family)
MIGQTSGNNLTGRRAGWLAGALGLLLALSLIVGGVLPAYANGIGPVPEVPHGFAGTVKVNGVPVLSGILVQAFVDGVKTAETTTDTEGKYVLLVPGHVGGTVTFKVAGTIPADESANWVSGELTEPFNLTIHEMPNVFYDLTMAVAPTGTGTATDVTNTSPYAPGTVVSIKAVPAIGYQLDSWTAPAGVFSNATAESTTFTMPAADVTVTANFEEAVTHTLTMAVSPVMGGTATDVTGASIYKEGEVVTIQAVAASGYQFIGWTAATGTFGNANAASTVFTMPGADVTVTATFQVADGGGVDCFIATAAYGSPTAEQLGVLREFRDVVLLPSSLGAEFVSLYYKISPPIAEVISRHDFLRTAVKVGLVDPVVDILNWSYALWSERG